MPRRKRTVGQNMGRVQKAEPGWGTGSQDGGGGNWDRGPEAADRELREAHGEPLAAAYRAILGPGPSVSWGNLGAASDYLRRIERVMDQARGSEEGGLVLTRSEWTRLRALRDKWARRAEGLDPRYNVVGTFRGGLESWQRDRIASVATFCEAVDKLRKLAKNA